MKTGVRLIGKLKPILFIVLMALLLIAVMPIGVFAGDTHIVHFNRYPDGGGTTSPAMDWITVSDTAGTQLSVMAVPADGYTFYSWSDSDRGPESGGGFKSYSSSCLAPVAARDNLYAYFIKSNMTGIVVQSEDTSKGTAIGTRAWSWGADGQYFTISATPKDPAQYEFDHWDKNGIELDLGANAEVPMKSIYLSDYDSSTGEVTQSRDTYTAHFKSKGDDHGFRAVPGTEGGNITGNPYLAYTSWKGSSASVAANPNDGYDFVKWVAPDGSDYSTNKNISVPYPSPEPSDDDKKNDIVYTAIFKPHDSKGISAEARLDSETGNIGGGSVSPSYVEWSDSNKNQAISFTANPDRNMKFVKWVVPDNLAVKSSLSNPNLSVVMPASKPDDNITITAVFAADEKHEVYFDVLGVGEDGKYSSGIGGTVNPPMITPDENNDSNVNVQATPWDGYEFEKWELEDSTDSSYVVLPTDLTQSSIAVTVKKQSDVPHDVHIKAYYKKATNKGYWTYGIEGGDTSPRFTKWQSGGSFTITATPSPGYKFDHWEKYNSATGDRDKSFSTDPTCSVAFDSSAPSGSIMFYAYFKKESGYGIYSYGIQGGDTSPRFTKWSDATKGTSVTLSATPYDGYVFDHWRYYNKETGETLENYSKLPAISVKMPLEEMNESRYYYAVFKPVGDLGIYTDVAGNVGGATSPKFTQWTEQNKGTSIAISASPASGYVFDHWRYVNRETGETIENYSRVPTISVVMPNEINGSIYLYAVFKEENKFGIYALGIEGGEATPRFTRWTEQNKGQSINLTATPNKGYEFNHWRYYNKATNETIENYSFNPTISVRMPDSEPTDSIYYFAVFDKETGYGIYSYGIQGGDTSPRFTKWSDATKGTSVTLSATPDDGYVFDHWRYYNAETEQTIENYSGLATISIKMPEDKMLNNRYYYAVFRKISDVGIYSYGIEGGDTGPRFTQWTETNKGQSITLTATPYTDKGYEFDHWRYYNKETDVTIENYSLSPNISVVMPNEMSDSRYYYAVFKKKDVKGIYSYGVEGGDTSPRFTQWSQETKSKSIQLQATADEGYEFDHWRYFNAQTKEEIENYSTLPSISVIMPGTELTDNIYYYAVFKKANNYGIYSYGIQGGDTNPRFTKWSEQTKGTSISLTATAEDDYVFDHWRYFNAQTQESIENYSNLETISVKVPNDKMSANIYYYAVFRKTGDMGIYSYGIQGGDTNPRYTKWSPQTKGTSLTLTATPSDEYTFDHWRYYNKETGATIEKYSDQASISVVMPDEMTDSHYYYAVFKKSTDVGIYAFGIEGGVASPEYTKWEEAAKDKSIQLQATPAEGYEFDHWRFYNEATGETIENYSTVPSISVKMPGEKPSANRYYFAVFRKASETGIYSYGIEGGDTSPRYVKWSDQTKGTSITLTATPSKGYEFDHWRFFNKETGASIENYSKDASISVKMPEKRLSDNIYYYAVFKKNNEKEKNKEIHVEGKETGIAQESYLDKWRSWIDPALKYVRSTVGGMAHAHTVEDVSVYEGNKNRGYDSSKSAADLKSEIIVDNQLKHSQSVDHPIIPDDGAFSISELSGIKTVFVEGSGAKSETDAIKAANEKYGDLYKSEVVLAGDIHFEDEKGNQIIGQPSKDSIDATVVINGINTEDTDIWMLLYKDLSSNEFVITPISDAATLLRFTLPDQFGGKITLLSIKYN